MEPADAVPCSQESATAPYPGPDASSSQLPINCLKIPSNIILPSMPISSE